MDYQNFPIGNWVKVKELMLNDKDVCGGNFGKIFMTNLHYDNF